ncbi:MAG: bacillithiol system redox-active protein YtxJ [Bacteroidota bacterium]
MDWLDLNTESQFEGINQESAEQHIKGVMLFKHSSRCSISSMALNRLERSWKLSGDNIPTYYLDLLKYRSVSTKIAELYNVEHESPQVLIIKNGKCIYSASHSAISTAEIEAALAYSQS